jgi:hypothetical protein
MKSERRGGGVTNLSSTSGAGGVHSHSKPSELHESSVKWKNESSRSRSFDAQHSCGKAVRDREQTPRPPAPRTLGYLPSLSTTTFSPLVTPQPWSLKTLHESHTNQRYNPGGQEDEHRRNERGRLESLGYSAEAEDRTFIKEDWVPARRENNVCFV